MCIRDRVWPTLLAIVLLSALHLTVTTHKVAGPLVRFRRVSVSYTHLRAHETVLDLVCRLLLEKKKKKRCNLLHSHRTYTYVAT